MLLKESTKLRSKTFIKNWNKINNRKNLWCFLMIILILRVILRHKSLLWMVISILLLLDQKLSSFPMSVFLKILSKSRVFLLVSFWTLINIKQLLMPWKSRRNISVSFVKRLSNLGVLWVVIFPKCILKDRRQNIEKKSVKVSKLREKRLNFWNL